jgi:hypothetical protein
LQSPGQPLDAGTRAFMEPRFRHDFSRVRVHSDARAAESARAVNALGYTVGRHIVFDAGQFAPGTVAGNWLLAHELTHVVQQRGADDSPGLVSVLDSSPQESEADAAAAQVAAAPDGFPAVAVSTEAGPEALQRFPWLIAGAVAALVAGGVYAWWAYNCLQPVEIPMYEATFGPDYASGRTGGFRLWYYNQTGSPVPSNACAATEQCGATTTAIAGGTRELYREYIDSDSHDSYTQDTNNQALGRSFGAAGQDCQAACQTTSIVPPGLMDLSAPVASYWTPATGEYSASP